MTQNSAAVAESAEAATKKYTLTLVNDTDIKATIQVWHVGSRVYNEDVGAGKSTVFTPGINKKNFDAVFKFDHSGAPNKLKKKDISLESKNKTVTCTGQAFRLS